MRIVTRYADHDRQVLEFGEIVGETDTGGAVVWMDFSEMKTDELNKIYRECNSRECQDAIVRELTRRLDW